VSLVARDAPPLAGGTAVWGGDPYARAMVRGRGPLYLRRDDGWLLPLDVERWCAPPDEADGTLLARCRGSVLDIGCGPGRLVAGAARAGEPVLGVDVSPAAVARTKGTGAPVLCRSVFDRLPGEGRWGTALLADGNIGIGGDPGALLHRVRQLLAPGAERPGRGRPGPPRPRLPVGQARPRRIARGGPGGRLDGDGGVVGRRPALRHARPRAAPGPDRAQLAGPASESSPARKPYRDGYFTSRTSRPGGGATAPPPTAPRTSDDMYRYAWDGKVRAAGFSPYAYPPDAPQLAGLREPWLFPPRADPASRAGGDGCPGWDLRPVSATTCTRINRPTVHTV
jgi:SAM-dependent methyltransferase